MTVGNEVTILIKPFWWKDWETLWQIRSHQLAEEGIILSDSLPTQHYLDSPYEPDYHRMDQVYQSGRGNFWLAWLNGNPVGHIGAEDKGNYVELRRMYVRKEYRRLGIGTSLVQTLIDHCCEQKVGIIELWTAGQGPGRFLFEKCGFQEASEVGNKGDEIRMRLVLGEWQAR